MSQEYDTLLEARKSIKTNIEFFETLLSHLKGTDKLLRSKAVWATWCLHRYIHDHLIKDVNEAIRIHQPKEGEIQ